AVIDGEFMYYIPLTVVTTLLFCLIVALVINPPIAATFMRFSKPTHNPVKRKVEGFGGGILTFYERTLRTALKWPKAAMAGAFGFLVLTIAVYGAMGHGVILFPEVEPKVAHINITAAEGISLQKMDALTGVVERRLKEIDSPDIKGIETTVGGTGAGNP